MIAHQRYQSGWTGLRTGSRNLLGRFSGGPGAAPGTRLQRPLRSGHRLRGFQHLSHIVRPTLCEFCTAAPGSSVRRDSPVHTGAGGWALLQTVFQDPGSTLSLAASCTGGWVLYHQHHLAGGFSTTSASWEALSTSRNYQCPKVSLPSRIHSPTLTRTSD